MSTYLSNDYSNSKLLEWKAERKKQKEMDKLKERPPFVVGIVHHKISSPIPIFNTTVASTKTAIAPRKEKKTTQVHKNFTNSTKNTKKNLSKDTQKSLIGKTVAPIRPNAEEKKKVLTAFARRRSGKDFLQRKSINSKVNPIEGKQKPSRYKLNEAKNSKEAKKMNKSKKVMLSPKFLSNIKNNVKQNKQLNSDPQTSNSLGLFNEIVTENPEEKDYTIKHFECMLNKEKDKLQELCKKWTKIKSQSKGTEDIRGQINQAVGQTDILIKGKFKQFARLINCKKDTYTKYEVTYKDLLGFWDMMYIEVKDCQSRFTKLENLYTNYRKDLSLNPSAVFKEKTIIEKNMAAANKISLESLVVSDEKKEIKMQDNKNNLSELNEVNSYCITPFKSNKRLLNTCRKSNISLSEQFFDTPKNIYTSTPFSTLPKTSSKVNTSLILMKISHYDTRMAIRTPKRKTGEKSIEKSENNLKINLASKSDLNQNYTVIKPSYEKLNNDEILKDLLENSNKSNETDSNETTYITAKSDSGSSSSVQTVINNGRDTSIISPSANINLIKFPTENVTNSPMIPITNISNIHCNATLSNIDETHITIRNIDYKMTPIINQVPKQSAFPVLKKFSNKSCSILYTPRHQQKNRSSNLT